MDASDSSVQAVAATADELVAVFIFNAARGDFDGVPARRRDPDTYELLGTPSGAEFDSGDLVRCELSDGELVVRERVYRQRLV